MPFPLVLEKHSVGYNEGIKPVSTCFRSCRDSVWQNWLNQTHSLYTFHGKL